jgi:hypothetical protein
VEKRSSLFEKLNFANLDASLSLDCWQHKTTIHDGTAVEAFNAEPGLAR